MNTPRLRFKEYNCSDYPEWKEVPFCIAFSSIGNNTLSRSELSLDVKTSVRNIHYGDILIKYGSIIHSSFDAIPYIIKIDDKTTKEKLLKTGDVIFADTAEDNTVGKACEIVLDDVFDKIVAGLHTIAVRPNDSFAIGYLGYFFNSALFHNQLLPLIQGIKVSSISKSALFNETKVYYPSLPEQQKIADFLSSYDEKISIQRERVEALERRKKGLLQKVFSQEIRFKADDGSEYPEWSNSSFSSVFASVGSNTFSRSDLTSDNSSNIRNIHYGDVLIKYGEIINTEVDSIPYIKKSISMPDNTDKLLQNGDIVFADTAEDNTVGKACEIALSDVRHKIVSGLHTIAIRPTIQFASGYLGFFLNSSLFHDQLLPLIQGIKVSSISKKALFEETRVYYPSYQEQQKISNLLTNISEQIKVEKERLSTMETIKKGLLQGLFC